MRLSPRPLVLALLALFGSPWIVAAQTRDAAWRADIDTLVTHLTRAHPKPWLRVAESSFRRQAAQLRRDVASLDDAHLLTGIMRLAASLGDGHTAVTDLGVREASAWLPVRFAAFSDGLWITAASPELARLAGTRLVRIEGLRADSALDRVLTVASGDNEFGRRQQAYLLGNVAVLRGLGIQRGARAVTLEIATRDGRSERVEVAPVQGSAQTGWWQWGEMFGPEPTTFVDAFGREADSHLDSTKNRDLPLFQRDRRAYWWSYLPERRTLFFQLNNMVNASRRAPHPLVDTWERALSHADSAGAERVVLDLRYNSGGNGELIRPLVRALIRRDTTIARRGRLFVLTGGKTFSAALGLVLASTEWLDPILVGEPPGAPLNASGDAGQLTLPHSKIKLIVSTNFHQGGRSSDTTTVIPVQLPAPITGATYFAQRDPALDAVFAAPAPYPHLISVLRDSGGAAARRIWGESRARHGEIAWWQPFRWQELNETAYDLLAKGRTADAITGFEINAERNPSVWETWDSLGEGYLKSGRKAEGRAAYAKALVIAPNNWNAAEQRKILRELDGGMAP